MASLPSGEKVVLVAHSYGGLGISLAMERFPEKISVAVYLTALMPNYRDPPVALVRVQQAASPNFMDSIVVYDSNHQPVSDVHLELGKLLVMPTGFYLNDLSKPLLTQNKFGSVTGFL
ncbi:methylesterase 10-like [Cornus florida]|uniref:methylesterase 10-like n=1 Tax=Cornus florida TaxID=4283 RepID=UPI002897F0F6|nr:methylesterase 10-like [Cornus florida]